MVALTYLQSLSEASRIGSSNLTPGVTTLSAAISAASATSITVTSASGFPTSGSYYIMIDSEQMQVTAGQGTTTWTVLRGTNSTTAATHANAANVFQSATSLIPLEPGAFFEPIISRYNPQLQRNSFAAFYETVLTEVHSELKNVKAPASFETLTNFLSYAAKGNVTPTGASPYVWTFSPTLTSDDLTGLGAEVGNDTAVYHIAGNYCNQLELDIKRGTEAAMLTADFIGTEPLQMGAKTPALTRTGLNLLNPAYGSTWIDNSYASIGTTAFNDITEAKITLKNGFEPLYFLNGQLSFTGVARPSRYLDVELTQWYDSTSELNNALNTVGNGQERVLKLKVTGGPSNTYSFELDATLYWDSVAFSVDKATYMAKFTGRTVYDTAFASDWQMILTNGIQTVP